MSPLSHLLDTHAESIAFVGMGFPDEGEQPCEAVRADHLIPQFAFSNRLVGTDAILHWTPRDYAIAAGAVGGRVAWLLKTLAEYRPSDSEVMRGWDSGQASAASALAIEAWHYAQRALDLEELEVSGERQRKLTHD